MVFVVGPDAAFGARFPFLNILGHGASKMKNSKAKSRDAGIVTLKLSQASANIRRVFGRSPALSRVERALRLSIFEFIKQLVLTGSVFAVQGSYGSFGPAAGS
jgi:hypothetical protein